MSDVTETVEIATLDKEMAEEKVCNRDRGDSHTGQRNGRGEGMV